MSDSQFHQLSREELYEKVWSVSGVKLSKEWGVSDVAIAKRCRKLNIPRPPRGYWAKLEAGRRLKRPPLPPTIEQVFIKEAGKPLGKRIALPGDSEALHPLAAEFLKALEGEKLSYDKKRVHLRESQLPRAEITKAMAPRAAKAFHALLGIVEPRGIHFRKSQSSYDGGHFRKGNDRLPLMFEEPLVADADAESRGRRSPYGFHEQKTVPCGKLTIAIDAHRYDNSKGKKWTESEANPLEVILAEAATYICNYYVEAQKRHEQEKIQREKHRVESEIRHKKWLEEQALQRQEQARKRHADSLHQTAEHRKADLMKAAEWWRFHESTTAFIAESERRWRAAQAGELTPEQQNWLSWALETAKGSSPFESGYPDPAQDGEFDPAEVPFGGPYPETRQFPQPPSMPEIPAPVVVQQGYGAVSQQPPPKPYPFWLRYPRR
jgi:hypothetical protein